MKKEVLKPGYFGVQDLDCMRDGFDLDNGRIILSGTKTDIVFIGDSITFGWDVSENFKEFGTVVNRGISGDNIIYIEKRFDADALQLEPKVIVLMAGVNNTSILFDTPPEEMDYVIENEFALFAEAYQRIIKCCVAKKQKIIIGAITPLSEQPSPAAWARRRTVVRMNRYLQDLCDTYGLPFADYHTPLCEFDGITAQPCLTHDGLHPNGMGYERMDRVIRPILRAIFSK